MALDDKEDSLSRSRLQLGYRRRALAALSSYVL